MLLKIIIINLLKLKIIIEHRCDNLKGLRFMNAFKKTTNAFLET